MQGPYRCRGPVWSTVRQLQAKLQAGHNQSAAIQLCMACSLVFAICLSAAINLKHSKMAKKITDYRDSAPSKVARNKVVSVVGLNK